MSCSLKDDDMNDVSKIAVENPKVDAGKVSEVRKLLQVLRAQGISPSGYNLLPPFRRQMHVDTGYRKAES